MKNLEKKKKQLQKENDILSNSVNSFKKQVKQLENKDKYLKDLIAKRKIFIKKGNVNEAVTKQELNKLAKDVENKQNESNSLNKNSEKLSTEIVELEWKMIELQKTYNENEKVSDNQAHLIEEKIKNKKISVADSFKKFKEEKEKEKVLIQESVDTLNEKNQILENKKNIMRDENSNLEESTKLFKNEKAGLENDEKKLNENITNLENRLEELNNTINTANDDIAKQEEKSLALKEKTVKSQKKLDRLMTKAAYLVRKEDHLNGFNEYAKDVSARLGLDYQPFIG